MIQSASCGADATVTGEAENSIIPLIEDMLGRSAGVAANFGDLDDLPFPAFDLYPQPGFVTLMTSRGCPLRCTFCASQLVSGAYRWRPERVLDEILWAYRQLGVREFAFYDDALLTTRTAVRAA